MTPEEAVAEYFKWVRLTIRNQALEEAAKWLEDKGERDYAAAIRALQKDGGVMWTSTPGQADLAADNSRGEAVTDKLIEMLRSQGCSICMTERREAADEIERLRPFEKLQANLHGHIKRLVHMQANLHGHIKRLEDEKSELFKKIKHLQAEIDAVKYLNANLKYQHRTENAKLREALEEISEGKGRYDPDPKQHAINTIEDMEAIARAALAQKEGE